MAIDTIKSTAVLDGAIATADIADDAVTADKLANAINTSIAAKAPTASPVFTGNVGIGATSPTVLLDLESAAPIIRLTDSDASGTPECQISGAGGDLIFDADRDNEKASSLISFKVDGAERMQLSASGQMGLGMIPSKLLDLQATDNLAIRFYDSSTFKGGIEVATSAGDMITESTDGDLAIRSTGHMLLSSGGATARAQIRSTGTISLGGVTTHNSTILMTMGGNGTHHQHRWNVGPHYTSDNPSFYTINEAGTGVYLPHGNNAWSSHSDERIKENITPLGNVLSDVMDIRCVKYNLKSGDPSQTKIGFIAQDWQSSFPEVVDEDQNTVIESDGTIGPIEESESTDIVKAIAYTETIPVLLKAIQEQQALIVTLTTRITALEDA